MPEHDECTPRLRRLPRAGTPSRAADDRELRAPPDAEHLELEFDDASERHLIRLRRADPSSLLLVGRGFQWVQEYPLNR